MPISLPSHGLSNGKRSRVPSILVRLSRISRLVMPVGMPVGLRVLECMCGQIFSGKPLAEAKKNSINTRCTQLDENLSTNDQADQPRSHYHPPILIRVLFASICKPEPHGFVPFTCLRINKQL